MNALLNIRNPCFAPYLLLPRPPRPIRLCLVLALSSPCPFTVLTLSLPCPHLVLTLSSPCPFTVLTFSFPYPHPVLTSYLPRPYLVPTLSPRMKLDLLVRLSLPDLIPAELKIVTILCVSFYFPSFSVFLFSTPLYFIKHSLKCCG